jgi:osmoprotectant transport system ATP-binding protein
MRQGGRLEQYADPATLLSAPATDFVADFVGADRTLRRLSVLDVDVTAAVPWPVVAATALPDEVRAAFARAEADWLLVDRGDGSYGWRRRDDSDLHAAAQVTHGTTVEAALAALLAHAGPGVVVAGDGDGPPQVLTVSALLAGARR